MEFNNDNNDRAERCNSRFFTTASLRWKMIVFQKNIAGYFPCNLPWTWWLLGAGYLQQGPKYWGILGLNARGSWNQVAWSLQWTIYYMVKQHLETMLYKPLCHCGFKVSCAVYHVSGGTWLLALSLPLQSPFTWPSLQYPLFKLSQLFACKARDSTWFFMTRAMRGTWFSGLGLINPLFLEPVEMSPHPTIWLRKVGLLSSHSEPWVDATCSLKIEHPGCAENQAVANHRCSAEHVLLHALVKYTMQFALQHMFAYTWYKHVFWALLLAGLCAASVVNVCHFNVFYLDTLSKMPCRKSCKTWHKRYTGQLCLWFRLGPNKSDSVWC